MNNLPTLYFLSRPQLNQAVGQCDCSDCDCACATQAGPEFTPRSLFSPETRLAPAEGLRFYELDAENTIALGGEAAPAVLSSACLALLKTFPASASAAIRQMGAGWNVEQLETVIQKMVQHGVLVDALEAAARLPDEDAPLLSAWIHLTERCNLACRYCYLPDKAGNLAPETGRGIVDSIFRSVQAHHFSTVQLKYAGGEPLLNFPTLIDNYRYAKIRAAETGTRLEGKILSNAVLLSADILRQIVADELSLTISLDGSGPYHDANRPLRSGHGSFAQVEKGIRLALEHGVKPGISITISGASADGLPELVGWLLDLDLRFSFNFYRANELSENRPELNLDNRRLIDTLLNTYQLIETRKPDFQYWNALGDRVNLQHAHTTPCSVGRNYLVFDVHGGIARCQMEMGATLGDHTAPDPLKMMRAAPGGLRNIPVEDKPGCADCEWRQWCAGGCPGLAKQSAGSYSAKSPYCEIYREIIPALLRMDAKSLLRGNLFS